MSQTKTCIRCGHQGNMFKDFEEWDSFCKRCRAEVGPRKDRKAELGSEAHVTRRRNTAPLEVPMPPRRIAPKPVLP